MKKTALFMLAILAFSTPLFAKPAGVITDAKGEALVLRNGKYLPAHPGMKIKKKDGLKTGADSRMDFAVNDMAGVRLLGPTEVGLKDTAPESMQVDLNLGNIIVNMKKKFKGAKFQVQTPAAVLAVRGTQFWGREAKKTQSEVTTFAVREGTVEVTARGTGQSFTLEQGQALDLSLQAEGPAVRDALKEEMAAMEQASEIKTSAKGIA